MVSEARMRKQKIATGVLLLLMAFPAMSFAQAPQEAPTTVQNTENAKNEPAADAKNAKLSAADARKAQILEDTNRLYRMAEELKAEVAKSNKDILSVAVVKKADEIEKLAKSLKERMRNE
jgi:hypothetical protein